jgi:hypothetical protein
MPVAYTIGTGSAATRPASQSRQKLPGSTIVTAIRNDVPAVDTIGSVPTTGQSSKDGPKHPCRFPAGLGGIGRAEGTL